MNDTTTQKGSIRELRHEITAVLDGYSIGYEISELLSGRPGLSFAAQREQVTQAKHTLERAEGYADKADYQSAAVMLDQITTLIDAREAEANKPPSKADALAMVIQAGNALESMSRALAVMSAAVAKLDADLATHLAALNADDETPDAEPEDLF